MFENLHNLALFREHFNSIFEILLHDKFKDFPFMLNLRLLKDVLKALKNEDN